MKKIRFIAFALIICMLFAFVSACSKNSNTINDDLGKRKKNEDNLFSKLFGSNDEEKSEDNSSNKQSPEEKAEPTKKPDVVSHGTDGLKKDGSSENKDIFSSGKQVTTGEDENNGTEGDNVGSNENKNTNATGSTQTDNDADKKAEDGTYAGNDDSSDNDSNEDNHQINGEAMGEDEDYPSATQHIISLSPSPKP